MSQVTAHADCSAADVAAVLSDGWYYAAWVVGTARVRAVDADWPRRGSRIHHSSGVWPLVLDDTTVVVEEDLPRRLRLRARGWPMGEADVVLEVVDLGAGCRISLAEDAVAGPALIVPAPLRHLALTVRNTETLRRLALLAEGGAGARTARVPA